MRRGLKRICEKEGMNKETVMETLKKILPERERWRLEVLEVVAVSERAITSYEIGLKLNRSGFRTRVSSIHPFLDVLIEAGLCYRNPDWSRHGMRGFKGVEVTEKGVRFVEQLESFLNSSSSDSR